MDTRSTVDSQDDGQDSSASSPLSSSSASMSTGSGSATSPARFTESATASPYSSARSADTASSTSMSSGASSLSASVRSGRRAPSTPSTPPSRAYDPQATGPATTQQHDLAPGPGPDPWSRQRSAATDDRGRNAGLRLAFEGVLIALCGYLIGVAGLPPLFDAPGGGGDSEVVTAAGDQGELVGLPETEDGSDAGVDTDANPTPGAGVSVVPGRATWTTGYFQAALFKNLLEELGYEVGEPASNEVAPADVYPMMAEGTVDFWANSWMPNHVTFTDVDMADGSKVVDHLTVVGNLLPAGGLEGVTITRSVAEDNEITTLGQINDDPDLVALFDGDGNGKADVYGCPEDWTCDDILDEVINLNEWSNLEQIKGDYDEMIEASVAAVDGGEPRLQYTWSPSGYLTRLRPGDNVLWLSIGDRENMPDGSITADFDFDDGEPAALGPACTNDPCWLGWPAADIQVTASNTFLEENPSARVLFEQIELKVLDVALANVKYDTGENTEEDLARHAQEWIEENQDTVDGWLAAARAAG